MSMQRIFMDNNYLSQTKRNLSKRIDKHENDYKNRFEPTGKTAI